jgi:signal transduction histidine kinase
MNTGSSSRRRQSGEANHVNDKLFLRVTAPSLLIGLLLMGVCVSGARSVSLLQANLAVVLRRDVASLQAAQDLQIRVRQLRFHSFLFSMDPVPERLVPVQTDQRRFEEALATVRELAGTPTEQDCVAEIEQGYRKYRDEMAGVRAHGAEPDLVRYLREIADAHPINRVVEPCQELLRMNREKMEAAAAESTDVGERANRILFLFGICGPVGGLALGYGVARGLRRSIYQLSVRVQDVAQRLDQDVASIRVVADGDLQNLDRQLQVIVERVEEVAERLQRHQRELIRAEQLSAMGQLAANVAHEVRNPLTGIKMLVESALRSPPNHALTVEDLRVIHREVGRLEQTVQGFLNLARTPTPKKQACDLREIVGRACELVRSRAEQVRVSIHVSAGDDGAIVQADPDLLQTVLVNLFFNAIDEMPGGGRLEIEVTTTAGADTRIVVADTGKGIPEELLPRLFTPFLTTKATGTGLGLSLSRRIVEDHGGRIVAGNRSGSGAVFAITLPGLKKEACHAPLARDRR